MAIIQLANIPVTNSILKGWKEKNTRHQWSPASNHTIWPHTDNIIATRKWHLRTTRNIHTIYILLHNVAIAPYQLHTSSQCCYSPIPSSRGQEAHVKIFSGPQMSPKMLKMQNNFPLWTRSILCGACGNARPNVEFPAVPCCESFFFSASFLRSHLAHWTPLPSHLIAHLLCSDFCA